MKKIISTILFNLWVWLSVGLVIILCLEVIKIWYSKWIPERFIWTYYDISVNQEQLYVGDIMDVHSDRWFISSGRIVWEDYLYCESDWISTWIDSSWIKKKRFKADATTIIWNGRSASDWDYWKTQLSAWYVLQEPWENCYIESRQEFTYNWVTRIQIFDTREMGWYFDILPQEEYNDSINTK